jgi:O-methyltransferase
VNVVGRLVSAAKTVARHVLPATVHAQLKGAIQPQRLVPVEELARVDRRALAHLRESAPPVGDYLEFGVFRGDSLLCMDQARREAGLSFRLFGFDSFEGLPELAPDDQGWTAGSFRSNYGSTRRRLTSNGIDWSRTVLVKGWFDETLTPELRDEHELVKASTIMIDCDLYSSAKTALEFSAPLIRDEAIIFFDDWDGGSGLAERGEGEARAFGEFLAAHPEFTATEFDSYRHTEMDPPPVSKVFSVRRVDSVPARP